MTTSEHTHFAASRFSPLVMTALFDERSFALFDELRGRHFPAALNRVPAHATLFHALPGEALAAVAAALDEAAAQAAPLPFAVNRTLFLGRGVALALESPGLVALRGHLARLLAGRLAAQDRQPYRPHVTVQNKVTAVEARQTEGRLSTLLPLRGTVAGLALWHYRGGPWEAAGRFPFTG